VVPVTKLRRGDEVPGKEIGGALIQSGKEAQDVEESPNKRGRMRAGREIVGKYLKSNAAPMGTSIDEG